MRICSAITASKNRIEVYIVKMAQQTCTYDCGLFAIAYAVDLRLNNNPTNVVYDQNSMRLHYNTCIAKRRFIPFEQAAREVVLDYEIHRFNKDN